LSGLIGVHAYSAGISSERWFTAGQFSRLVSDYFVNMWLKQLEICLIVQLLEQRIFEYTVLFFFSYAWLRNTGYCYEHKLQVLKNAQKDV
jgi:hypothetical protein